MNTDHDPSMGGLLDLLEKAGEGGGRVTVGAMLDAVGRRSFGALLLVPGLIAFSPLSGIPGMPTTVGLMVFLIAGQLLLGRRHFWLPQALLRRSVSRTKFDRALRFLRPVSRRVDRLVRPRLSILTTDGSIYFVCVMAILVALTMPPLELVPFAATMAGAALTAFGLALLVHDGLLLLVAAAFYGAALGFILKAIL